MPWQQGEARLMQALGMPRPALHSFRLLHSAGHSSRTTSPHEHVASGVADTISAPHRWHFAW